ncbi:MAG TPA: hypothetical protein DCS07_03745 [Bdellovibrionales bacterium]|nr:hypothetical protein [Bdellovibrionales bacterium]
MVLNSSIAMADSVRRPGLAKPRKELFSHANHTKHFDKLHVQCTDCHTFAIKAVNPGPTGTPVKEAYLKKIVPGLCHDCHLGKVSVPLRKNCLLCHSDLSVIQPQDHYNSWRARHGKLSEMDRDSCTRCHSPQDCTSCHAKQNTLAQKAHRPNFRLTHSIQARSEPQSCTFCHKSAGFCMDCHKGTRR